MNKITLICWLLFFSGQGFCIELTDRQGRQIEVELVTFDKATSTVEFTRSGSTFKVPLSNLDKTSAELVESWWAQRQLEAEAEAARLAALEPGAPLPQIPPPADDPVDYRPFYGPMTLDDARGGRKGLYWHHFDESGELVFETRYAGTSAEYNHRGNAHFQVEFPVVAGHYKVVYETLYSGERADFSITRNSGMTAQPKWLIERKRRTHSKFGPSPYVSDIRGLEQLLDVWTLSHERSLRNMISVAADLRDVGWIERELLLPGDIGIKGLIRLELPGSGHLNRDGHGVKTGTRRIRIFVSDAPHPHGLRSRANLPPLTVGGEEAPFPSIGYNTPSGHVLIQTRSGRSTSGGKFFWDIERFDGSYATVDTWLLREFQQKQFLAEAKQTEYWYDLNATTSGSSNEDGPNWRSTRSTRYTMSFPEGRLRDWSDSPPWREFDKFAGREDLEAIAANLEYGYGFLPAYRSFPTKFAAPEARPHLLPSLAMGGWSQKLHPALDLLRIRTTSGPRYGNGRGVARSAGVASHSGLQFKIDLHSLGGYENKFNSQTANAIRVSYQIGSPGLEYLTEHKWNSFVTFEARTRDKDEVRDWYRQAREGIRSHEIWGPHFKADGTWRESFFYISGHIGMWHIPVFKDNSQAVDAFRRGVVNYDGMELVLRNALGDVFIRDLKFERLVDDEITLFTTEDLGKDIFSPALQQWLGGERLPMSRYLPLADYLFEDGALNLRKPEGLETTGIEIGANRPHGDVLKVAFTLEVRSPNGLSSEQCLDLFSFSSRRPDVDVELKRLEDDLYEVEVEERIRDGRFLRLFLPEYVESMRVTHLDISLRG